MLSGILDFSKDHNATFTSFFIELENSFLEEALLWNAQAGISQFVNELQGLGVFLGNHEGRMILIIFQDFEKLEAYQDFCTLFLYSSSGVSIESIAKRFFDLLQKENTLTSVYLIEGLRAYYLSIIRTCAPVLMPLIHSSSYQIK